MEFGLSIMTFINFYENNCNLKYYMIIKNNYLIQMILNFIKISSMDCKHIMVVDIYLHVLITFMINMDYMFINTSWNLALLLNLALLIILNNISHLIKDIAKNFMHFLLLLLRFKNFQFDMEYFQFPHDMHLWVTQKLNIKLNYFFQKLLFMIHLVTHLKEFKFNFAQKHYHMIRIIMNIISMVLLMVVYF